MSLSKATANNDPLKSVPSDRLWLRSELMGTQVITTDTGKRLGLVGEVVVDIDRREVVALGLRDNPLTRFLPGLPKWMPLESIKQVGDVILVDSLDSLSDNFSPDRYSKVINCQVITESGQLLGRVLGFSFDIETGELISLVMGAVGVPILGEGVLSTWEIPVDEIVSSGTDRIIVYEGAEEKLNQLSSGLLEKLGVGGTAWDNNESSRYSSNLVPVENQLLSGTETIKENYLLEESSEQQEDFEDEYEENEYEENEYEENEYEEGELEYIELDKSVGKQKNKKQLYMNDEYQEENVLKEEENQKKELRTPPNRASKRPVERTKEALDVEPISEEVLKRDLQTKESIEIDDPW